MKKTFQLALTLLVLFHGSKFITAQEPKLDSSDALTRAIKIYKEGEAKEAVKAFRLIVKEDEQNPEAWFYLGLSLAKAGDPRSARKSYEKALKIKPDYFVARTGLAWAYALSGKLEKAEEEIKVALQQNPDNAEAHFILGTVLVKKGEPSQALTEAESSIQLNPHYASAYLLRSQALIGVYSLDYDKSGPSGGTKRREYFGKAADSLETYLQLSKQPEDVNVWREQLATLQIYGGHSKSQVLDSPDLFSAKDVDVKAVILSKSEPSYTEEARHAGIEGKVVLMAVLGNDATVKNLLVIKPLPCGLTKACMEVARKIKFQPAVKDGKPVSMVVRIEYNFSMY